jgi:hypothetical protein
MPLITPQKMLAGIKPIWAVRNPIMQMMPQLIAPRAQPSQQRRPTRIVEAILNTQER